MTPPHTPKEMRETADDLMFEAEIVRHQRGMETLVVTRMETAAVQLRQAADTAEALEKAEAIIGQFGMATMGIHVVQPLVPAVAQLESALATKDAEIAALKAQVQRAIDGSAEMQRKVKKLEKELAHALSTAALREMDRPNSKRSPDPPAEEIAQ